MFDDRRSFLSRAFLRSTFELDYKGYTADDDAALLRKLRAWADRLRLSETQAEGAFTQTFFVELWGYGEAGRVAPELHTLIPKLPVRGEGAGGGQGEADLALGWFRGKVDAVPQVLCEFKDIRSKLDAKQNRKGSVRSPVEQCLDYVRGARRGLYGAEPVLPWWGLVTDMNEFRLYWWDRAPAEYLRFTVERPRDLLADPYDLLTADGKHADAARFDRFLFSRLFHRDTLLSEAGRPPLLRLVDRQGRPQRRLEGEFYDRYRAVRERLFNVIRLNNADVAGTPTELLRLCQKLLDRFIFVFFCEDMGQRMLFPPDLVRDRMAQRSAESGYDESGDELWSHFKRLFARLNDGKAFGQTTVPAINGGLFEPDPAIDRLAIPNHFFAKWKQGGGSESALASDKDSLLYLCARYDYAGGGGVGDSITLFTLGRIFEQSIVELEYRAGELEGRETTASLGKRKRDGVYYTPEPVVNYLVEETLRPWFVTAKAEAGYPSEPGSAPDVAAAVAYVARLAAMRIVDPACGSGAFLISAFRALLAERLAAARDVERASGREGAVDEAPIIDAILRDNLYGVDINPASVEIAKLALWLHSARAAKPLSSLAHTLRAGNSLVGPGYWRRHTRTPEAEDRVRPFDWNTAFPEVFAAGGFDVVLGNPPYVKLQNLMKVDPEMVSYLRDARGDDGYASAQTGNFDLYLPFIEKGLRLLRPGGRMAYIAPSLWAVNEYGQGLRAVLRASRQLERWLDFKAHQVFDEAITYTALQFYTAEPNEAVRVMSSPTGETADVNWSDPALALPYEALPADGEWLLATGPERALIDRLACDCARLDDPSVTSAIYQGLITSADWIYHLERRGPGRYVLQPLAPPKPPRGPRPAPSPPHDVEIEDAIMKPLVSGREAKRYEEPGTSTYLLFPYERDAAGNMGLIPAAAMTKRFPKAWKHLKAHETELRGREKSAFDDDQWYRFGRNQSIDKQDVIKLIVAQTVPEMRVCSDDKADRYLNNVRVNGIIPAKKTALHYLLGLLNSDVIDFVFRRIAKPKQGGWFEANKQFIAPLPIPRAGAAERAEVAERARALQDAWTERRDLTADGEARLGALARARHGARWLWPDLPERDEAIGRAPRGIRLPMERRKWADSFVADEEEKRVAALQAALDRGGRRDVAFDGEALGLTVGGETVLGPVFVKRAEGPLAAGWWRWLLLTSSPRDAATFAKQLRQPPNAPEAAAAEQFLDRVRRLAAATAVIEDGEAAMNALLYDLYRLTPDERMLVENDRVRRAGAAAGAPMG